MSERRYMGYSSPQALEAALNEKDEHFEVAAESLLFIIVCSDLSQEEVIERMDKRISGTSAGWQLSQEKEQGVPCERHPGFKHYHFTC